MDKVFKKLSEVNGITAEKYRERVGQLIREEYSQSDEFAILRQRDEKPVEFAEYNQYAEACKAQAKAEFFG